MAKNYEELLKSFLNGIQKGIIAPQCDYSNNIIWDDYKAMAEEIKKRKGNVAIYTLIDCDNEIWIVDGYRFVNRVGYIISTEKVEIPEEGLRYM